MILVNFNLDKKEKALLILGLAFFVIDIILLIDYFIVGTVIGISAILIFVIATLRKRDIILRFSKITLIVFFLFILLNPAPQHWVSQFNRRWMDNWLNGALRERSRSPHRDRLE